MKKQKINHRLPNTNIVIDSWKPLQGGEASIRFMTIFRLEDHQLRNIKRNDYKIYTSVDNKKLLEQRKIPADRIIAIEPGNCLDITDEYAGYSFKVSTIESNYCVGSCMFLFQGPFGNILYTGFFRPARSRDPLKDPILKSLIRDQRIDEVYIDNSYAGEHCLFPSRADVIRQALQLIEDHPEHKVIIAGNKFGKEEVLREIAMSLDGYIGVSKSKFEELSYILGGEALQKFSVHQDKCRVVVEDELLTVNQCKKKQVEERLCIIILLTAQYECEEILHGTPPPRISNLHILPYSSHASHCELIEFLYYLKARKISPVILPESENTRIPQNLLNMCYTNGDSACLLDSDFYFDTVTSLPASESTYKTANESQITQNGCSHLSRNVNSNTLTEEKSNNSNAHEPMDLDAPSNTNNDDSVESDEYHESESVAFVTFLEVQDESLGNECGHDSECLVDPLSMTDTSDVSVVYVSVEPRPNVIRNEAIAKSSDEGFQDHGISISVSESGLTEPVLHSNGDSNREERTNPEISKSRNDEQSSLRSILEGEEEPCDEILSSDIIGSDGVIGQRTKPSPREMEVDDDSSENLIIPDRFDPENLAPENFSSSIVKELVSEENTKLTAVLYHLWLTTNVEDLQRRTNLTEDSWADLHGAEFF